MNLETIAIRNGETQERVVLQEPRDLVTANMLVQSTGKGNYHLLPAEQRIKSYPHILSSAASQAIRRALEGYTRDGNTPEEAFSTRLEAFNQQVEAAITDPA